VFLKLTLRTLLLSCFILTGCYATPERDQELNLKLGKEYKNFAKIKEQAIPAKWWTIYNNEELNQLIDLALLNNSDIEITRKKIDQAAAVAGKSFADLLPEINATGEREYIKSNIDVPSSFSLLSAASYELDLWGKNKATYKASTLEAQASIEDLKASAITVSASIIENWLRIAAIQEEESLLKEQILLNETIFDLLLKRYSLGGSQALDVLQQKEILARTQSLQSSLESDKALLLNQIAYLSGTTPSLLPEITVSKLPSILPLPSAGLPAELLKNRPDIVSAWLRLEAADWTVKAAWADRLPSINLSGNYSLSAGKISNLLDSWLLELTAGLAAPVFNGGLRKNEQKRTQALADEWVTRYKDTILNAVLEVEDSLARNHYQTQTIELLKSQLKTSKATLEQAQTQYIGGNETYLTVLSSLNNVQTLERQLIQEKLKLFLYRVQLYRSIGYSSWTSEPIMEAGS
jgi:NodT family efflux transporter outer membrane factor (OMF) lipoprotein